MSDLRIQTFFDEATFTATHVVACPQTRICAVIDSVLDYDPHSGRTSTASAQRVVDHVQANHLEVAWLLETHAHADHLSAAPWLQAQLGGRIAIGAHICEVQSTFKAIFDDDTLPVDGTPFDRLLAEGDTVDVGKLQVQVLHTPGHTPACVTYVVGQHAFIGDTLFMPDYGSARCDFPGADARALYRSVRKVLALPSDTTLHLCHDYPPEGRSAQWTTTVGAQRAHNIHMHDGISEDDFVQMRTARDKTLGMPRLLLPSVQVNVRAGHFPPAASNGTHYLKIPLNLL